MSRWYTDPMAAGHRVEAIAAMCEEFLGITSKGPTGRESRGDE